MWGRRDGRGRQDRNGEYEARANLRKGGDGRRMAERRAASRMDAHSNVVDQEGMRLSMPSTECGLSHLSPTKYSIPNATRSA